MVAGVGAEQGESLAGVNAVTFGEDACGLRALVVLGPFLDQADGGHVGHGLVTLRKKTMTMQVIL